MCEGAAMYFRQNISLWITARSQPRIIDPVGNSGGMGRQEVSSPIFCSQQITRGIVQLGAKDI